MTLGIHKMLQKKSQQYRSMYIASYLIFLFINTSWAVWDFFCEDMQFFYLLYVLSLCSKSWLEPYNSSLILMGHIPLPNLIMLTIQAFIVVSDEDCTKTFIPYKPKNTQISYFSAFVKSLWNIYWDWFELEMIAYI